MAELVHLDPSPFHQKMSVGEKKKNRLLKGFPNSFYLFIFKNKRQASQHGPCIGSSSTSLFRTVCFCGCDCTSHNRDTTDLQIFLIQKLLSSTRADVSFAQGRGGRE